MNYFYCQTVKDRNITELKHMIDVKDLNVRIDLGLLHVLINSFRCNYYVYLTTP